MRYLRWAAGFAAVLLVCGPAAAQNSAPMPMVITPSGPPVSAHEDAVGHRGEAGIYVFDTAVNGVDVRMMFDTGASLVTLRADDAARAGIDMSALSYSHRAATANGVADVAITTVHSITIGDITRRNITVMVAKPGALNVNLLGQSFLQRIAGFRVEGNRIVLQGE